MRRNMELCDVKENLKSRVTFFFHYTTSNRVTLDTFRGKRTLKHTKNGADNKKCIRMPHCVRKPCPHAAPHRIQTQPSSHYTASYLFFKFPQTSEKNYIP